MPIAESTHWYTQEGHPMYSIIGANGKERNTTLRDARKYDLVPSVTTIIGQLDKPALTQWKVRKSLEAAHEMIPTWNRDDGEITLDEFVKMCQNAGRDEGMEKADIGSLIHADIERGFRQETMGDYWRAYENVCEKLWIHYPNAVWVPEASFCAPEGYGGKVDLFGYAEDGTPVVVDFKTKDDLEGKKAKSLVYDEHAMQLSAYGHAIFNDDFQRMNIFIDRDTLECVEYVHEDTHERDLGMFLSLLSYWQLSKGHTPRGKGQVQATI